MNGQDPRLIPVRTGTAPASLVRIRRGVYADPDEWRAAFPEQRVRAEAEALILQSRGAPIVFAHASAAAYWGLPLFRTRVERVHVVQTGAGARSTSRVMRHTERITEADVTWLDDGMIGVTTLERTVFDLIRTLGPEASLALADAALRTVATGSRGGRDLNVDAAETFRAGLAQRARGATGVRGIRQARDVIEQADARAESVGESVSRLYLGRIGFTAVDLQVPVPGPYGRKYEIDFDLGEWWGEFDGDAKYTDPEFLRGRTPQQALADEKEREDWLRGRTGKPFARWGFVHMPDETALGRRLAAFGVRPPNAPKPHLLRETTPR